jgi:hypothetical protein
MNYVRVILTINPVRTLSAFPRTYIITDRSLFLMHVIVLAAHLTADKAVVVRPLCREWLAAVFHARVRIVHGRVLSRMLEEKVLQQKLIVTFEMKLRKLTISQLK